MVVVCWVAIIVVVADWLLTGVVLACLLLEVWKIALSHYKRVFLLNLREILACLLRKTFLIGIFSFIEDLLHILASRVEPVAVVSIQAELSRLLLVV